MTNIQHRPDTVVSAAAYARVSTGRQAREGFSLAEQQRSVEAHIAAQGWTLTQTHTYVDAGLSGKRDDRPELVRLLSNTADLDVLVIPKLDRLGRSTLHLLRVCADLKAAGVRLVSLGDSIDTSTAGGQMILEILAAVASFESARIGERVASVSEARVAKGGHHGRAPYGYRTQAGALIVIDAEAAIVRRIFAEYAAGRSQHEIARGLNRDGISPQRSRAWRQATLSLLLDNPVYIGLSGTTERKVPVGA